MVHSSLHMGPSVVLSPCARRRGSSPCPRLCADRDASTGARLYEIRSDGCLDKRDLSSLSRSSSTASSLSGSRSGSYRSLKHCTTDLRRSTKSAEGRVREQLAAKRAERAAAGAAAKLASIAAEHPDPELPDEL